MTQDLWNCYNEGIGFYMYAGDHSIHISSYLSTFCYAWLLISLFWVSAEQSWVLKATLHESPVPMTLYYNKLAASDYNRSVVDMKWRHADCRESYTWCYMLLDVVESESTPQPVMCDRPLNMFYVASLSNPARASGHGTIPNCPGKCNR